MHLDHCAFQAASGLCLTGLFAQERPQSGVVCYRRHVTYQAD